MYFRLRKRYSVMSRAFRAVLGGAKIGKTMKPIDPLKVIKYLAILNEGREAANPLWIEAQGLNALVRLDVDATHITFFPTEGFPVKIFLNTETDEMKLINARKFSAD